MPQGAPEPRACHYNFSAGAPRRNKKSSNDAGSRRRDSPNPPSNCQIRARGYDNWRRRPERCFAPAKDVPGRTSAGGLGREGAARNRRAAASHAGSHRVHRPGPGWPQLVRGCGPRCARSARDGGSHGHRNTLLSPTPAAEPKRRATARVPSIRTPQDRLWAGKLT